MDIFRRTLGLFNIKNDQPYERKNKKTNEETEKLKTKSQMDFENGIDDKPVITDVK